MWKLLGRADLVSAGVHGLDDEGVNDNRCDAPRKASETIMIDLLGLARSCWRCGSSSTALIGMMEVDGDLFSEDLILCATDELLKFAWGQLPTEARTRWNVGDVAYRNSKTARATYLTNGCASCDALFGAFPLFHEEVPEALATRGSDAFVTLAVVEIPRHLFDAAYDSRW